MQNWSGGKIITFLQSQALTSYFEIFWSIVHRIKLPYGHEFMEIQYKPGRMANQKYQHITHHYGRQAIFRSGAIFLLLGFAHFHG